MKKMKIVLFGNGQMAETAHMYLNNDSPFEVTAFCVDHQNQTSNIFRDLPLVAFENVEQRYPPSDFGMFVPMSAKAVNTIREEKFNQAKGKGYKLVSYISPHARVFPNSEIGENCFILENNVIQPCVNIGSNTILWSGNHIGHHTTIGSHCFVASHVVISGRVNIGSNFYFGVNSTFRDGVVIAPRCIIGAGALIMRDTEENQVYMGLPGKRIPQRTDEVDIV